MKGFAIRLFTLCLALGAARAHAADWAAVAGDITDLVYGHEVKRWRSLDPDHGAICRTRLGWLGYGLGTFERRVIEPRPKVIPHLSYLKPTPCDAPFVVASKNQSNRPENRGKLLQVKGKADGIVINGKQFPQFDLHVLPKTQIPVAVCNPDREAVGRVILLHGLGYSISNVYSVTSIGVTLNRIARGGDGDPFATWFAKQYPGLVLPLQVVLMDLPPMGWAPPLEEFASAIDVAEYLRAGVNELDLLDPQNNFYVSRSASGPLSVIAGRDASGVFITGATFPSRRVLNANRKEVQRLEKKEGEEPNWPIINNVLRMFSERSFRKKLEEIGRTDLPIWSAVGSKDAETPRSAQYGWNQLFDFGSPHRAQFVIQGAGHQVFLRPKGLSPTDFSETDPDVQAYRALLTFLARFGG